jgi:tRNA (Thr-GGU) A37 N-methylase
VAADLGGLGRHPTVALDAEHYGQDALFGLQDFSHVEVVFYFHRVPEEKIETGARHPRGNPDWPLVGIFAQRGKNRPNRLGVSRCKSGPPHLREATSGADLP